MDWYQHNIGDYDADTLHLSAFQDGVYSRLIRWYYREERPIPDGDQAWASIARIGLDEWLPIAAVIRAFFIRRESRVTGVYEWHHKRCNGEIRAADRKRRLDAKRQARRRKHNMFSDPPQSSRVSHAPRVEGEVEEEVERDSESADTPRDQLPPEHAERGSGGGSSAKSPQTSPPHADAQQLDFGTGPPAKQKRSAKPRVEPHVMPDDWQPSEALLATIKAWGITDDEIRIEIDDLRWYWTSGAGAGTARPGWDATTLQRFKQRRSAIIGARRALDRNGQGRPSGHNGANGGVLAALDLVRARRRARDGQPQPDDGVVEGEFSVVDAPRPDPVPRPRPRPPMLEPDDGSST